MRQINSTAVEVQSDGAGAEAETGEEDVAYIEMSCNKTSLSPD